MKVEYILYNYDNAGNVLSVKVKKSSNASEQTIKQVTYDLLSRIKTQIDGNGNITYFEYNELGKICKTVYPSDETIELNTIIGTKGTGTLSLFCFFDILRMR